jgi:hypothetical protein
MSNAFFVYTTNFHHTLLYPTELYDFDFGALWTIWLRQNTAALYDFDLGE